MEFIIFNGFDAHSLIYTSVLLLLLCVSALASASEVALFSLTPSDIREVRAMGTVRSENVLKLLKRPQELLSTILVTNNLVNIAIVILSAAIIDSVFTFRAYEFLFTGVIATFLLLLFGEILPKVAAQGANIRVSLAVAGPLTFLGWIFRPLSYILIRTGSKVETIAQHGDDLSIEEIADAVDMTQTGNEQERKMLSGIVQFAQREVEEIMRPRVDIVAIDIEDGFDEVKRTIISSGYSRIPVFETDMDHITGVLYVKDLIGYISEGDSFAWQKLCRKACFVPLHKKINSLLDDFQRDKVHIAIVVDEFGATQGLVSLEDIIEEVVGEISDESDTDESFYRRLNDNTFLFDGKTHIVDLARVLQIPDDTFEDVQGRAETIAGLLLEINRRFLNKDEETVSHSIRFIVASIDGHRIDKVKVIVERNA